MKVALVHDDLIQTGGAEKLLLAMHEIWPEASIYTSFASDNWLAKCKSLGITVKTSFMQILPFKECWYRFYFWLFPLAFESFNFDDFDLVISSSARFAHGVVTKPKTTHICYMNTPARMWWEPQTYFASSHSLIKLILSPLLSGLRLWDFVAAQRVDWFIANSKTPQERIKKYFGRESDVVYPFADLSMGSVGGSGSKVNEYFLIVTRLSPWKRVDIAVTACKSLNKNLVVVGQGSDLPRLKNLASDSQNIKFLANVDDTELAKLYSGCQAVIITQEEDFGIVAVEAARFGKPVLAFGAGGSREIIKEGVTGEFFSPQTAGALEGLITNFNSGRYANKAPFVEIASQFGLEIFKRDLQAQVEKLYALSSH